jgi:pimeloyl-ACP methyl ester carboxylesterase
VHFQDGGGRVPVRAGERALVLLHQSPSSSRQFEAAFEFLIARGIRFVAIDTPGFGFSDPTPSVPRIEDWVPSVVAVLDHLGLEQVDVLGHHTGSLIATELALQHPRRVRRLVLNGPFPLTAAERAARLERSKLTRDSDQPRLDGSHLLETFRTRLRMYGPDPDLAAVTRGVALKYQALGPHWWGHHAAYLYDHERSLGRVTQPTLIFTNTGDDLYDLAQRARTIRPDFAYLELQGGTHDIVDQQPEAWSDAVAGFLRRPERPVSAR